MRWQGVPESRCSNAKTTFAKFWPCGWYIIKSPRRAERRPTLPLTSVSGVQTPRIPDPTRLGGSSRGGVHGLSCTPFIAEVLLSYYALPFKGHIKIAEQRTIIQQYGDQYTGRRWVGCYIWYSPRCTKCNSPPIDGQCANFIVKFVQLRGWLSDCLLDVLLTSLFFLWDLDLLLDVCACLEFIDSGMFSCGSGDLMT